MKQLIAIPVTLGVYITLCGTLGAAIMIVTKIGMKENVLAAGLLFLFATAIAPVTVRILKGFDPMDTGPVPAD